MRRERGGLRGVELAVELGLNQKDLVAFRHVPVMGEQPRAAACASSRRARKAATSPCRSGYAVISAISL